MVRMTTKSLWGSSRDYTIGIAFLCISDFRCSVPFERFALANIWSFLGCMPFDLNGMCKLFLPALVIIVSASFLFSLAIPHVMLPSSLRQQD